MGIMGMFLIMGTAGFIPSTVGAIIGNSRKVGYLGSR